MPKRSKRSQLLRQQKISSITDSSSMDNIKSDPSSEGSKAKKLSKSKSAVTSNEVSINEPSLRLTKSSLDNGLSNISKAEITLSSGFDRSKDGLRNENGTESVLKNGPINIPVQYTQVNGYNQNSNTLESPADFVSLTLTRSHSSSSAKSDCDWNGNGNYLNDCENNNLIESMNGTFPAQFRAHYNVNVANLKNQYANHNEQNNRHFNSKQDINTGVDFESLKNNYNMSAKKSSQMYTKNALNKDLILTRIDINSIKNQFTNRHANKESESVIKVRDNIIKSGLSVSCLKSSFIENDHENGIKVDTSKYQRKFSQQENKDETCLCTICEKHVYQMEMIKAEKKSYHKSCFRCKQCSKPLSVDNYNSHEGELYCQPHFKLLHQPKPKFGSEDLAPRHRRNEMIISENIPQELPADVVRYDSKLDDGLTEHSFDLSNIRQRFESGVGEKNPASSACDKSALQRSESLSIRLQRYQSAILGEKMSANHEDDSSNESENEVNEVNGAIRESKSKEKVPFTDLSSLKSQWETGSVAASGHSDPDRSNQAEKREELFKLRERMCLGRSASMRQVYEKACNVSKVPLSSRTESLHFESSVNANSLKEKFEKGEVDNNDDRLGRLRKEKEEDLSVVTEAETAAREAKNKFKQMDASLYKNGSKNFYPLQSSSSTVNAADPNGHHKFNNFNNYVNSSTEIVKCNVPKEEVTSIETSKLQERFKFFECYKEEKENRKFRMTPPRDMNADETDYSSPKVEIRPDPNVIRSFDMSEEIPKIETTSKMLNKFKQLENQAINGQTPQSGPKPLKRITPPREFTKDTIENQVVLQDPNIVKSSYKSEDVVPVEPKLARSLTAKFENWAVESELEKENKRNEWDSIRPQLDLTKNLRAKFEAIKDEPQKPLEKSKPRVNRFVNESENSFESCNICHKRLYPLERLEFTGMKVHKSCFKCSHCCSALRLENYTLAAGKFYCIAHFKQLFMAKGNYEEGFGVEQHKEKWKNRSSKSPLSPDHLLEYLSSDDNDNDVNNQEISLISD